MAVHENSCHIDLYFLMLTVDFQILSLLIFLSSLDTTLKQHMIQATTTKCHFQRIVRVLFFLILTFSEPLGDWHIEGTQIKVN